MIGVVALVVWSPPLEPLIREGSAQRQFVGLGVGLPALMLAFLHGVVQTGLTEELLAVVIGAPAAYAIARLRFRGRGT